MAQEHQTVAVLNLSPESGRVESNLLLARDAITAAKLEEPDLAWVVLPELLTSGYTRLSRVRRHAESAESGPSVRFFHSLARDLGLHIAYGFPEQREGGSISDSANLVGPEGVVLTYRKRHLVRAVGEHRLFKPGAGLAVANVDGVRVALVICWDLGFPEVVREAAHDGAVLILAPVAYKDPWGPQYELMCAARALDNAVYLASANQLGDYPEARFGTPGGLYSPDGRRVSDPRGIGRVSPDFPEQWRRRFGSTLGETDNGTSRTDPVRSLSQCV